MKRLWLLGGASVRKSLMYSTLLTCAPAPPPPTLRNNLEATQELSQCILSRVMSVVQNHHLSPNIATAVQPEMHLLLATLAIKDRCWEHRLRTGEEGGERMGEEGGWEWREAGRGGRLGWERMGVEGG